MLGSKKIKTKVQTHLKALNIGLAVVFTACVFTRLIFVNHGANQNHEISAYRAELNALRAETSALSLKVVELQSSERLIAESKRLQLVAADSITYLAPQGVVALKN